MNEFYEVEDDNNSSEAALAKLIVDIIVLLLKVGLFGLIVMGLIYLLKAILN